MDIPSVTGEEAALAGRVGADLEVDGFRVEFDEASPGRPNLIARAGAPDIGLVFTVGEEVDSAGAIHLEARGPDGEVEGRHLVVGEPTEGRMASGLEGTPRVTPLLAWRAAPGSGQCRFLTLAGYYAPGVPASGELGRHETRSADPGRHSRPVGFSSNERVRGRGLAARETGEQRRPRADAAKTRRAPSAACG